MDREVIIDNEFFSLWYYPGNDLVHHQFKKYVKGDSFRELLMAGTKLMQDRGATKWLSDDRDMPVLSPEDEEWGRVNWFPATMEAGWRHWAIVLPGKLVGEVNMKRLSREYSESGINTQVFKEFDDAFNWIVSL